MASKPGQPMSDELILEARAAVARHGSISAAAEALGLPRKTLADRAKAKTTKDGERPFPVPKERPQPSFVTGPSFEIVSRKDNTFVFGAAVTFTQVPSTPVGTCAKISTVSSSKPARNATSILATGSTAKRSEEHTSELQSRPQ